MAIRKVMFNLDERLIEKLDKYADDMNINRTSAVSILLNQALMNEEGRRLNLIMSEKYDYFTEKK